MPDITGDWGRSADDFRYEKKIEKKRPYTYFHLIRHAESEINLHPEIISGRTNHSPLTRKGIEQAKKLGVFLKGIREFDAFYCSPAQRCIDTLFNSMDYVLAFNVDYRLQELDQGEWTGKVRKEAYTPEAIEKMQENPWTFKAPGGESQEETTTRAYEFFMNMEEEHRGKRVAVFTHGGLIKYLCAELFDWDRNTAWKVPVDNASVTRLTYNGQWKLKGFNTKIN